MGLINLHRPSFATRANDIEREFGEDGEMPIIGRVTLDDYARGDVLVAVT